MSPTRIAAESVAELPVVLTTVRDWALAAEATSSAAPARSLCIWELGSWGVGVLVRWKVRPQLANSPTPWGRLLGRLVPPPCWRIAGPPGYSQASTLPFYREDPDASRTELASRCCHCPSSRARGRPGWRGSGRRCVTRGR